jgi:uncharacterized membrane protein YebE (DUF533 family)
MAAITTILAIGSLVVAAGSAYMSYKQNQQAANAQKKAGQVQQAEQTAQKQNEIRNQVRQDRIKRAQILQSSQNSGVSMSSGSIGSQGALGTQIGTNIGQISRNASSMQGVSFFNQQSADASSRAATFGQVAGLATSGFNMFANTKSAQSDFAKWFK